MGHTTINCENIFNTKRKTQFLLIIIDLQRGVEWAGSFLKNFQKGVGGYRNSEVFATHYVVFVATELHSGTIFYQHFLT